MEGKTKIILLGIVAACALTTIASAAASATQWHVSGTAFNGTETVTAKIKPGSEAILEGTLPGGAKLLLVCKTITSVGALIVGNNKDSAKEIIFTQCTVKEPVGCVTQPEITTKPLTSEIVTEKFSEELLVFDTFTPASGSEFMAFKLTACSGEGLFHVLGIARALVVATGTESTEKELTFSGSTGSNLKYSKEPMTFTAAVLFSLSGPNARLVWSGKAA